MVYVKLKNKKNKQKKRKTKQKKPKQTKKRVWFKNFKQLTSFGTALCQGKYSFSFCHICRINTRNYLKSKSSGHGQLGEELISLLPPCGFKYQQNSNLTKIYIPSDKARGFDINNIIFSLNPNLYFMHEVMV